MGKGTTVIFLILLVLISSGCITNTKELTKIDELTTQIEEKDSQITDLSSQLEARDKKISEVGEKNSELSSQIVTKNEEISKQSNDLRKKEDQISTLTDNKAELEESKTKLEEKINQLKSNLSQEQKTNTDTVNFLKEYSIVLVHIHRANTYFEMASANLNVGNDYVLSGEYYYVDAKAYYDAGKDYVLDGKELLLKAKKKLEDIQDDAPDSFFQKDVVNRVEQIDTWLLVVEDEYLLLDYADQSTYEINYGTEAKSLEYTNKYNDRVIILNSNLKKLSDIQNTIDLEWDQDWYPTFRGTTESSGTEYL